MKTKYLEKIKRVIDLVGADGERTKSIVIACVDGDGNTTKTLEITNRGVKPTNKKPDYYIPAKLEKLLYYKRIKVIYGGRGSGKTRNVTTILGSRSRVMKERVVCFREIMRSVATSTYQEIVDWIHDNLLSQFFRITETDIKTPTTKSKFNFAGLYRNQETVKGYAGATVAWVDEAENISQLSWDILTPTIRKKGSEVWITFNPRYEDDPTWTSFVKPYLDKMVDGIYEDEETLIIECNHSDNYWFTEELKMDMERMRRTDLDRYLWIWEGRFKTNSSEKILSHKCVIEDFEPSEDWGDPYFGADFGFSQDPSTLVKCWVYKNTLYVEYARFGQSVEMNDYPDFYDPVPGSRKYKILADSARPETISHIKRFGFNIEGVYKWSGSVEDGITFLKGFEKIVIHSRCKDMHEEISMYRYKLDPLTGEPTANIVDAHNHGWDAIRYALQPLIKKKPKKFFS